MKRIDSELFSLAFTLTLFSAILAVTAPRAAGQDRAAVNSMVQQMVAARESQTQIPYLTRSFGPFSMAEAYQIQAVLAGELSKRLGPVVGYKVAYASKAAQEQFGMDEPASAPLFLVQRTPSGSEISSDTFSGIVFETEVAFTLGKRIDRAVKDVSELKDHVQSVHAAFDIGDSRFQKAESKPTPQDVIASGIGAHIHVIGPARHPDNVDVDAVTLKLARNGELLRESAATNVMGSPWNSLLWLANSTVSRGGTLGPGTVVVSGTAAPAYRATGDDVKGRYVGDCGPLGKVTLTID